jgi:hypothetical protein
MMRLSRMKADKVAEFLGRQGSVVVLSATPALTPDIVAKRRTFLEQLNAAGLTVLDEQVVVNQPGTPPVMVSMEAIHAVTREFPRAEAVILLSGVPHATGGDWHSPPEDAPHIISVSDHLMLPPPESLVQVGLISLAIANQATPPELEGEPESDEMWFDFYFQVLTAGDNLD